MSGKKHAKGGRNFDGLTPRFKRNIYDTPKGQLRLAVLKRDFQQHLPNMRGLSVLDVGVGQGQFAQWLAQRGAGPMTLVDISEEMLEQCRAQFESLPVDLSPTFIQCPVQTLSETLSETLSDEQRDSYDVIVCHALMEWLETPEQLLSWLEPFTHSGSYLSLIFYNLHGLVYKNLLRQNFKKLRKEDYRGYKGSLTPINPMDPETVLAWLKDAKYEVVCHSGIRVFHDYILDPTERKRDLEGVTEMELHYSQKAPYRDMGRYVHMLCKTP